MGSRLLAVAGLAVTFGCADTSSHGGVEPAAPAGPPPITLSLVGAPRVGYYSYDVGAWHVVVLDTRCADPAAARDADTPSCAAGSAQERWLRGDLLRHPARCTLALWQDPGATTDADGNYRALRPLWQALDDNHADLIVSGNDRGYQRYNPQRADGTPDEDHGIRELGVLTGGIPPLAVEQDPSAARDGTLELTLTPEAYDWTLPGARNELRDSGRSSCH